jgi:hypothetical protein
MAVGKCQPYGLMQALKAQEAQASYKATQETPYDTEAAREAIVNKLKAKHRVSTG